MGGNGVLFLGESSEPLFDGGLRLQLVAERQRGERQSLDGSSAAFLHKGSLHGNSEGRQGLDGAGRHLGWASGARSRLGACWRGPDMGYLPQMTVLSVSGTSPAQGKVKTFSKESSRL